MRPLAILFPDSFQISSSILQEKTSAAYTEVNKQITHNSIVLFLLRGIK